MQGSETLSVRCCIAGGGPAGMMLGFLLARAGIEVAVLEKHADFLRDFRGDTIHPSTLDVMGELGLLDEFLKIPHDEIQHFSASVDGILFPVADFTHLHTRCKFLAFMPQWDFLNFLAATGAKYPTFHLLMETEATDLLYDGERVIGVRASSPHGPMEIHADLTVAADGRSSTLRKVSGAIVTDFGAPIDVLWLRLPREAGDPAQVFGYVKSGRIMVALNRTTYWQIAFVITKGSFDGLKERGLEAFRASIADQAPFLIDRVDKLETWDDVKLLTVQVDRLERWWGEGFLCIGDAAHAMSPIGGVGINLAIQDAVAAANILWYDLVHGNPLRLDSVERRRKPPTIATQRLQLFLQNNFLGRVLSQKPGETPRRSKGPLPLRLLAWFPILQRIPPRLIGVGFGPEHVLSPEHSG